MTPPQAVTMSRAKWAGQDSRNARAICKPLVDQGVACYRCKKPILPGQQWHPDHIIDRALGGTNTPDNLWPSHARCNTSAGGKMGAAITNARRQQLKAQRNSGKNSEKFESFGGMETAHHGRLDHGDGHLDHPYPGRQQRLAVAAGRAPMTRPVAPANPERVAAILRAATPQVEA